MPWNVWNTEDKRWMLLKSVRSRRRAIEEIERNPDLSRIRQDLEPRRVVPVLEANGTKLMQLKPSMIWATAMRDLHAKISNQGGSITTIKHYAFHRKHVHKAETPNDILRAAIADPEPGRQSAKAPTRLLYADIDLLKASLQ